MIASLVRSALLLFAFVILPACTKQSPPEPLTVGQESASPAEFASIPETTLKEVDDGYERFLSSMGSEMSIPVTLDVKHPDPTVLADGEKLSWSVCGGCHLRPQPLSAKKTTWVTIFQLMRSGMWARNLLERPAAAAVTISQTKGFPPRVRNRNDLWAPPHEDMHVALNDLGKIFYYYMVSAPYRPVPQKEKPAFGKDAPFKLVYSSDATPPNNATYSLAYIDEVRDHIILGRADEPALLWVTTQGKVLRNHRLPGVPTGILVRGGGYHVTMIGDKIYSDEPTAGSIVRVPWDPEGLGPSEVILKNLERPVMVAYGDLDADGLEDALVSEFGLFTGSLSWYRRASPSTFENRRLFDGAGVVGAHIVDIDGDAAPDVVAAVGQADEEVILFHNQGKGRFNKHVIAKADPSFGMNSIHIADMDGDGDIDILTANGDDYGVTRETRNTHGIRIFENQGSLSFREHFVYPMYGALQLVTRDFDQDGDQDIAAISRFADINASPPETFVYLENTGGLKFIPRSLPKVQTARWLAISAGDYTNDGAADLVLTAYEPPQESNMDLWDKAFARKTRPQYVFLYNMSEAPKPVRK